jgi:exopolyphosphatase/guanosine-5'-triphosphate,3'-diphosphate pyrophosphatase
MRERQEGQRDLRIAAIDVGTNSVRLLVADVWKDGGFQRVFGDRRITRLGEGFQSSGRLSQKAIERTLETLRLYMGEARKYGAEKISAAATSAVRDACNGDPFVERVRLETGLKLSVLSAGEEAIWMAQGVCLLWAEPPTRWMAVDIGGGSTEFVMAMRDVVRDAYSVPLGMVHLTEEVLKHDPPLPSEIDHCKKICREMLRKELGALKASQVLPDIVTGTAGTITTLAALELALDPYDGERVSGYYLSLKAADRWSQVLGGMKSRQRRELPGMEAGREDVILAGVIILCELISLCGINAMLVSDYGLLEGIAIMAVRSDSLNPDDS